MNQRVFLWAALALVAWLLYDAWMKDYHPRQPVTPSATAPQAGTPSPGAAAPDLDKDVPSVPAAEAPSAAPAGSTPASPVPADAEAVSDADVVRVVTDVIDMDISLQGGQFVREDLLQYAKHKGEQARVRLFNTQPGQPLFKFQSGLRTTAAGPQPDHQGLFTAARKEYRLANGQNELVVPLTWTDGQGVTVTKTFTFQRARYHIRLDYQVVNHGTQPWSGLSYVQFYRDQPPVDRSMFDPDTYAFGGPALWDGEKYRKLSVTDDEDKVYTGTVTNGWFASMQHHFVAAAVPAAGQPYNVQLNVRDHFYRFRASGSPHTVQPGATAMFHEDLFAGPKLQAELEEIHPELHRATDYNKLWFIARPLFILLEWVHKVVRNWGWAIIIVTALLKLLFYPLSEASGRSMAKMRALAPRIKNIQERYKDDREQLGRAMMELYKREKINPLAGCLPIVIQIPVFLAFYWVLLESVEMRQAPFMLWINDLSSRDPIFVLPLLMGGAMFAQYKLNPAPPDPVQAKVFMFMPIIMTAMFAWFPSGLVLYWLTNTLLSIAQQWRINRVVEAQAKKAKTE